MQGPEKPGFEPTEEGKEVIGNLEILKQYRENATEDRRKIAENDAAVYEIALLELLDRSDKDPKLLNAMRYLTSKLYTLVHMGDPSEKIRPKRSKIIMRAIKEASFKLEEEGPETQRSREHFEYEFDENLKKGLPQQEE